jgi:hypothetical protein
MYYLKNNTIPEEFNAPGLKEAREQLKYDSLSPQEKIDYNNHVDQIIYEQNFIETSLLEGETIGLEKGKAIGLEEGEAKATIRFVIEGYQNGLSLEQIQLITMLTAEQITEILKQQ